jgi:hypothetical protein
LVDCLRRIAKVVNKLFAVVLMANVDRLETHTNQWHDPRMKYVK